MRLHLEDEFGHADERIGTQKVARKKNLRGLWRLGAQTEHVFRLQTRRSHDHDQAWTEIPESESHTMSSLHRSTRLSGKDEKHTPIQRSRVKKETTTRVATDVRAPSVRHIQVVMVVRVESLEDATLGCCTTYTGPALLVLNGVSSMSTPSGDKLHLLPGSRVRVCTRKVIPFNRDGDFCRVHFSVQAIGHVSNCRCGACNSTFSLIDAAPAPCNCGSEDFDEGAQSCNIM